MNTNNLLSDMPWEEKDESVGGFEEAVDSVRANLRSGGPPVDYAALDLHTAGELDEETSQRVREYIVTYEAWNRAFWELTSALAEGEK